MKVRFLKYLSVITFSVLVFIVGCRKGENVQVDNETQSAVDNAVADQEFAAIVPATNNYAITTKGTGGQIRLSSAASSPCDTLIWLNRSAAWNGYPKADTTINISTGNYSAAPVYSLNAGTTCSSAFTDGKIRSGSWIISLTGPLKAAGSVLSCSLINYVVTNTAVAGPAITYSCTSLTATSGGTTMINGYPAFTYTVALNNGVCNTSDWTINYSFNRTIQYFSKGDASGSDPYVAVSGTSSGLTRLGKHFAVQITSPLIKHKSCPYIDKGKLNLTPDGFATRYVDFGNGSCSDQATFTVNGQTVTFKKH
ncbi:MAG: hypothetical protein JSU07_04760 [Bacteroidetes bacterium]|nr:hypothetical protein [Bacteroidota bacterium]